MRVPQQLEILDLSLDSAGHVPADELLSGDDLERHLLTGAIVDGQANLAEGSLAQRADDFVGANTLLRPGLLLLRRLLIRGALGRHRGLFLLRRRLVSPDVG